MTTAAGTPAPGRECPLHGDCERYLPAAACAWRSGELTWAEAVAEGEARQDAATMGDSSDGHRAAND